jgi:hypothetical protein
LPERAEIARDFASQFKVSLPILVDTIDNKVENAYTAMPDRIYVIDAHGKIAYKSDPGPAGFKAGTVPPILDRLLNTRIAAALGLPKESPRSETAGDAPGAGGERISRMLSRAGFNDQEAEAVQEAVRQRMDAYRELTKARSALVSALRDPDASAQALKNYEAAEKRYAAAVAKIDDELDAAIGYRRRPAVHAALVALGLIGQHPAPPLAGLRE